MASEARAELITLTIVANGTPIVITNAPIPTGTPASLVNPPTSAQGLSINTGNLNLALAGVGSNYQFTELGVTSNWSGTTDSTGAFLKVGGTVFLAPGLAPDATSLTISVTEDGFTAPVGSGAVLTVTANSNFAGAPAGSTQGANTGSYNATDLNVGDLVSSGVTTNNPSASMSMGIGSTATGFSLDNSLSISLLSNAGSNSADTFAVTAQVTAAVPEPASMVVMLTGMPLPLAVVGLLLRRRRAVA
jgi:hypothetical protein